MIIYIDEKNHCHVENDETRTPFETDFFNGKCKEFIEGWVCQIDDDGTAYFPWENLNNLKDIQSAVDRTQDKADEELAALIEQIYQEDLEDIFNV